MPSTLTGLVIFIALLLPGFVFLTRRETRRPGREYSTFRELATVLMASLVIDSVVLGFFGVARAIAPGRTPDVGAIVRDRADYFQVHYLSMSIWSGVLLGTASTVAAFAAAPPARLLARLGGSRHAPVRDMASNWGSRSRPPIREESGWSTAFHRYPDCEVWLGVHLKDGAYLAGGLMDFNPQIAEDNERSLQLAGPVEYRPPGHETASERLVGAVLIPAEEIRLIEVTYVDSAVPTS